MALKTWAGKAAHPLGALALVAALSGVAGADPLPMSPTLTTPPVVTEVGGKTLTQWMHDLDNSDPSVREEAVLAVSMFGPSAAEAVPELLKRLHDPDASPRSKAAIALGFIKADEKDRARVVEALGETLSGDSQAMVRYNAAVSLGELGPDSQKALGAVLHGVEDPSSFAIRRVCVAALVAAGQTTNGPDPRATHALLTSLSDRAAQVRLEAVLALGQMGRPADPTLQVLVLAGLKKVLNDRDKTVVLWAHVASMALVDKVDDADMDFVTRCLKTSELERVRVQAVRALGVVGAKSPKVAPQLIELLGDESFNVQGYACVALGGLGKDAPADAEKALADLGDRKEAKEEVKTAANRALDAIRKAKMK